MNDESVRMNDGKSRFAFKTGSSLRIKYLLSSYKEKRMQYDPGFLIARSENMKSKHVAIS